MPDPRELRDFLKANATVLAPGETLVIRAPDLNPMQMREVMEWLNWSDDSGPYLPFRTVVVPGDGFAVARSPVVHRLLPGDNLTTCCQRAEAELPKTDYVTADSGRSTCAGIHAARKALGLPTWPVPECDEARETP